MSKYILCKIYEVYLPFVIISKIKYILFLFPAFVSDLLTVKKQFKLVNASQENTSGFYISPQILSADMITDKSNPNLFE